MICKSQYGIFAVSWHAGSRSSPRLSVPVFPTRLPAGWTTDTLAAGIGTVHASMEGQTQRAAAGVAMEAAAIAIPLRPLC